VFLQEMVGKFPNSSMSADQREMTRRVDPFGIGTLRLLFQCMTEDREEKKVSTLVKATLINSYRDKYPQ
jgi:hypothetical protein